MTRIVVVGDEPLRLLMWELLSLQGLSGEIAFVDDEVHPFRRINLGIKVNTVDWLQGLPNSSAKRIVIGANYAPHVQTLIAAGWSPHKLLVLPPDPTDRNRLAAWVDANFPDPLKPLIRTALPLPPPLRFGIFGTGAGGRKVWEALMTFDGHRPAWFSDNNEERQGGRFFGLEVIAPSSIPTRGYAGIVIASVHRAAIAEQLLGMGVTRTQMIKPDVAAPLEQVRAQIATIVEERFLVPSPEVTG